MANLQIQKGEAPQEEVKSEQANAVTSLPNQKEKSKQEPIVKQKRRFEINKERGAEGGWSISKIDIETQSK